MIPFAARFISRGDLDLFAKIERAVKHMADPDLGINESGEPIIVSCHIMARAVVRVFPSLRVKDGRYVQSYEHSWIETPDGNLIDVYPVAVVGGPIMLVGGEDSPQSRLYTTLSAREVSGGRFGKNSFRRSVLRVARALRKAPEFL